MRRQGCQAICPCKQSEQPTRWLGPPADRALPQARRSYFSFRSSGASTSTFMEGNAQSTENMADRIGQRRPVICAGKRSTWIMIDSCALLVIPSASPQDDRACAMRGSFRMRGIPGSRGSILTRSVVMRRATLTILPAPGTGWRWPTPDQAGRRRAQDSWKSRPSA